LDKPIPKTIPPSIIDLASSKLQLERISALVDFSPVVPLAVLWRYLISLCRATIRFRATRQQFAP